MPAKKNNQNESSPISEYSLRGAFNQPETGNHICLSRAPSILSFDCGSCCSFDICSPDNSPPVNPTPEEIPQAEPEKGKCDKCGLQPPDTHVAIQTSKNQVSSTLPCIVCGGSTGILLNKSKYGSDTDRASVVIPANCPNCAPNSLGRTSIVNPMTSQPLCPDERCRPQPPCADDRCRPPTPPKESGCQKPGCPTSCCHEEKNDSSKIPGHSFGMPPCAIPRRQSSNIARNFSSSLSTSLLKNGKSDSKHRWNKWKCSKTSVISECKCTPKQCLCHYPPAYQHYFQCTGAITGVCCCSENK